MAEEVSTSAPKPVIVEYDPVTGVPSEFNSFLPSDCPEYKKWKASLEGPEALEKLRLKDADGNEIEKQLPGGKVKKKQKPQVVITVGSRGKNKTVTTILGLELFGIKLAEASKLFGKKFACGASVTKSPEGKDQIDMQGDFLATLPDLLIKNYKDKVTKADVFFVNGESKKKESYYGEGSDDED